MVVYLMGLPGSGRRTFVNKLKEHYDVTSYHDFYDGDMNTKSDITCFTMFTDVFENNIGVVDIFKDKLLCIVFPKVFVETEETIYSEFFGCDIKYIYGQKSFNRSIQGAYKGDDIIGNFGVMDYTYDFDKFKESFDKFKSSDINMMDAIKPYYEKFKSIASSRGIPLNDFNDLRFN